MKTQIKHFYASETTERAAIQAAQDSANQFLESLEDNQVISITTQLTGQTEYDSSCLIAVVFRSE